MTIGPVDGECRWKISSCSNLLVKGAHTPSSCGLLDCMNSLLWGQHFSTWCNELEGLHLLTGQLPLGVVVNQSVSQSVSQSTGQLINQ